MEKRWTEYLPHPLRECLIRIKAFLCRAFFPTPCAVFARLPIRPGKIVFDNYRGKAYGCNPKYVAQELIRRGTVGKYDLVWLVSRTALKGGDLPPQIRAVRYGSLRSFYEYATAQVWVSNYHKAFFVKRGLRKRKEQLFIQMWHGSLGIKKIENAVPLFSQDKKWRRASAVSSGMTDFWISNSGYETEVYKSAFWNVRDEAVLLYGHPRNDIFFDAEKMRRAREKAASAYGTEGKKILLYAPTFRDDLRTDCYGIDFFRLAGHMKRRFGGEWAILVRLHPRLRDMAVEIIPPGTGAADATRYADMQELLAAADCLITDYSSCAFDFMLTRRPVFLFATDIQKYNNERGFYYPLEATPFPLACDNTELMKNIDEFREDTYLAGIDTFLREKGCVEDGHASERVADLIERFVQPTERERKAKNG